MPFMGTLNIGGGMPRLLASGGTETTFTGNGLDNTINGANYKRHTFLASGILTVTRAGWCDILMVGGGGGGGGAYAGQPAYPGNGGQVLEIINAYLPLGAQTVTVGGGGAGDGSFAGDGGFWSTVAQYQCLGGRGGSGGYEGIPYGLWSGNTASGITKWGATYGKDGTSSAANTGNGGVAATAGGSGIVIVRYIV